MLFVVLKPFFKLTKAVVWHTMPLKIFFHLQHITCLNTSCQMLSVPVSRAQKIRFKAAQLSTCDLLSLQGTDTAMSQRMQRYSSLIPQSWYEKLHVPECRVACMHTQRKKGVCYTYKSRDWYSLKSDISASVTGRNLIYRSMSS